MSNEIKNPSITYKKRIILKKKIRESYDCIGTSGDDICPKCSDCMSWFKHYKYGYDVFCCTSCNYCYHYENGRKVEGPGTNFFYIEEEEYYVIEK